MEAFSDGVFGVAATLLVVDLALRPPGSPLEQVLHAWPAYLAYVVSFLTIGAAWLGHTAMTDRLEKTDQVLMRLNLLLLLIVAFLPFPTRLVADALNSTSSERVFVTLYGVSLLAIRVVGFALDSYARHEDLYAPETAKDGSDGGGRGAFGSVVSGYLIAILVGLVVPEAAVAVYFGLALYLVLPLSYLRGLRARLRAAR
jgi:uncharacterized membrane protein